MIPATVFWGLLSEYYEKSEIQDIIPAFFRLFFFPQFTCYRWFSSPDRLYRQKEEIAPSKAVISSNPLTGLALYQQHFLNHNANTFLFLLLFL